MVPTGIFRQISHLRVRRADSQSLMDGSLTPGGSMAAQCCSESLDLVESALHAGPPGTTKCERVCACAHAHARIYARREPTPTRTAG